MFGRFSFRRIFYCLSQTIFLVCISSNAAFATESSVLDVLMRMQTATQNINYQGTLVYLQDGQVQSMRVVHKADQNGEVERLINLNGAAREIVRKNDVVTCYMPDRKMVSVGRRHQFTGNLLSQLAENDFGRLQDYYSFEFEVVERVAGQSAQRILIKPKDTSRYGYRLWVDEANTILLKSDLLDEQGGVLEQTMFADIQIGGDIPDVMLAPQSGSENFTWFEHEPIDKASADGESASSEKGLAESRWAIADFPQGFNVTTRFHQQMPNSSVQTEHWIISDGLANISIYIEQIPEGKPAFEGASPMGATNAFGVLKQAMLVEGVSNSAHQITVIGEVPASTVEKLAHAVMLKTQ